MGPIMYVDVEHIEWLGTVTLKWAAAGWWVVASTILQLEMPSAVGILPLLQYPHSHLDAGGALRGAPSHCEEHPIFEG